MIESVDVLAAAGSIVQVEARHAALIRLVRDERAGAARRSTRPATWTRCSTAVKPFIKA